MDRPACGTTNPDGARFCIACGTPLARQQPARRARSARSSASSSPTSSASPAAPSSSTPRTCARCSPRTTRALRSRDRALRRDRGEVHRRCGHGRLRRTGHARGRPRARRPRGARDPRRRRELNEANRLDLHVRIAVNTGEASSPSTCDPSAGEGMVAGDVVNTAARLQQAAPVDGDPRRRDDATARPSGSIEYARASRCGRRGRRSRSAVWEAVAARARFGVDVEQRGAAPLVGRERGARPADATARAHPRERRPQLVTLVGVPGIGKSRLVSELVAGRRRRPGPDRLWRQGRSLPYGEGVASGRSARW